MLRLRESCSSSPTSALGSSATTGVLIKCETSSYSVVMVACSSRRLQQDARHRYALAVVTNLARQTTSHAGNVQIRRFQRNFCSSGSDRQFRGCFEVDALRRFHGV